jgi:Matrixin
MRLGSAGRVLVAAACVVWARDAHAFCRTVTCPLPADWNPTNGCLPTSVTDSNGHSSDFASYCATLSPPAKVLPVWWRNACVSYDIQKNASRQISYDTAATVIAAAFAKWTTATCPADAAGHTKVSIDVSDLGPVTCDQVEYDRFGGPNQHVIVFRDSVWPHNDANNTLGLTTVTFDADTGEIYDADTEINGTVPLGVGDPVTLGVYDFESIITHEAGHFLGLAHSGDSSATMYAHYTPGSTSMRSLTADDVAGLCSIYPPNATRNVDPSVGSHGSVAEDSCNPAPRNGFTTQCIQPRKSGCAVAPSGPMGNRATEIILGALASIGIARKRRRGVAPSTR